jgi:hypothetical protein
MNIEIDSIHLIYDIFFIIYSYVSLKLYILYLIYSATISLYNYVKKNKKYKPPINKECPICLDINDKYWIKTICNHEFHFDCIKEWKVVSETCPICRSGIGIWN